MLMRHTGKVRTTPRAGMVVMAKVADRQMAIVARRVTALVQAVDAIAARAALAIVASKFITPYAS